MKKCKVRWAFRLADGEKCKVGEVVEKPVKAKVISVVDDRVVLEFLATKIQGVGSGGGKVWADGLKIILNREELNFEAKNKIIVDETGDLATLLKAKAIGARGIVQVGDKIISGLPIIRLSSQQMEIIRKLGKESNRIWINGTSGKIFIT
jgi:hypothetical protein